MVIIIAMMAISQFYARDVTDQVIINQIDRLAKEIVDTAEEVYYLGAPSRETVLAYIPEKVDAIIVNGTEIVFSVRMQEGVNDIGYPAQVNLSGSINASQGLRAVIIEAREGYVWINGSTK